MRIWMIVSTMCLAAVCAPSLAAERFEVAAWVDHFDFAAVQVAGQYPFDTETVEGCAALLEHVAEVGTTTVLWRNCAGGTMRYPSQVETYHQDSMLDKRKIPDGRPVWGWVRYGEAESDLVRAASDWCRRRRTRFGIHWPFEETHGAIFTVGGWNLEHPQFWARTANGTPWWGRCSIAFPEVLAHRLALVRELLDRGMDSLFIDTFRAGGWTPGYEYVQPVVAAWRERFHCEPPSNPKDRRWCEHVAGYVSDYFRALRRTLDASGRKVDLMLGVYDAVPDGSTSLIHSAVDWPRLVEEGIVDTLVINWVTWSADDPFGSTRRNCRAILDAVQGRCRVLWPVRAYDYGGYGMPSYQKATGLSQAEIARRLMEMAWEEGADGISLECVDYNNYGPETRKIMRTLAEGKCQWVRNR